MYLLVYVLLCGSASTIAATAESAPKARITVLFSARDVFSRGTVGLFEHFGMQRLRREPGLEVVEPEDVLRGKDPAPVSKEFEAACSEFEKGVLHYENLELAAAVGELACAADLFEKAPLEVEKDAKQRYSKSLIYLGAALILKGEPQRGQAAFRRLIVYDKRAKLDERIFPPTLVRTFETVRRHVMEGSTGTLSVFSRPGHARVYLNGLFRGVTPCNIEGLSPGRHLLVLRKLGQETWAGTAEVEENAETQKRCRMLDVPDGEELMKDTARFVAQMETRRKLSADLRKRLAGAGVHKLVLGYLSQSGGNISALVKLYEVPGGSSLVKKVAIFQPDSREFGRSIDSFFSALIGDRPDVLQFPESVTDADTRMRLRNEERFEEDEPTPVYKTWWFWTSIGVGAATVATLLALFVPSKSEPESMLLLEF